MELPTFLNFFLYLPVERRIPWPRIRYRIETEALDAEKAEWLRAA